MLRITDYDRIADRFDARYRIHNYDGVRETLGGFVGDAAAVLEVGCGTGHWLASLQGSGGPGGAHRMIAGIDPSAAMLLRARTAAPDAALARARAEDLPWRDASVDRVFCVNALHHFADRGRFFAEARRVLKPGGGILTIGKDPYADRDAWWVYDYFEETRDIDRARFARVRTLRGELAHAGFAWAESFEADRIEAVYSAAEALAAGARGPLDRAFTSQLTVLTDEEYDRGLQKLRDADAASGHQLQLVSDFHLYATVGWI
jgi:SAM-dependent methyltransferase